MRGEGVERGSLTCMGTWLATTDQLTPALPCPAPPPAPAALQWWPCLRRACSRACPWATWPPTCTTHLVRRSQISLRRCSWGWPPWTHPVSGSGVGGWTRQEWQAALLESRALHPCASLCRRCTAAPRRCAAPHTHTHLHACVQWRGWAGAPTPRAPPATSPQRTWCTCWMGCECRGC